MVTWAKFLAWDPSEPASGDVVWFLTKDRRGKICRVRFPLLGNGECEKMTVFTSDRARLGEKIQ